jgi:hypothetical protein
MSALTLFGDLPETSSAVISDDGVYRYQLMRLRPGSGPPLVMGMLNPSTANHEINDPTVVRCITLADRENASALFIWNLFGLRATDPRELRRHPDPVGPENDRHIRALCTPGTRVVVAWGNGGNLYGRDKIVTAMLATAGVRLMCLGVTKNGSPRHPLYVRADKPLEPYAAVIPS